MKKESVRRMGICILVSGVLYASSVSASAEELFSDSETVQNALASETEDVFSDGSDPDVFVSDETKNPADTDSADNVINGEDTITQDGIVYERGTYSIKVIGYTDELKGVSKITIPAYVGELRASLIWNTSTSHHP